MVLKLLLFSQIFLLTKRSHLSRGLDLVFSGELSAKLVSYYPRDYLFGTWLFRIINVFQFENIEKLYDYHYIHIKFSSILIRANIKYKISILTSVIGLFMMHCLLCPRGTGAAHTLPLRGALVHQFRTKSPQM